MAFTRVNPQKFGSGKAWYSELTIVTGGTPSISLTGGWSQFPIIKDSEFTFTPGGDESIEDEGGNKYTVSSSGGEYLFKGNLYRPPTKDMYNFFIKDRTKSYIIVKEVSESLKNGVWEYMVFAVCTLKAAVTFKQASYDAPFEFNVSKPPLDVTGFFNITAGTLLGASCGSATIAVDLKTTEAVQIYNPV